MVGKFTEERPPPEQRVDKVALLEGGRRFMDVASVAFAQPLPFNGGVTIVTFGQGTWASWTGQVDLKLRALVLSIPSRAAVYVPFENIKYYELAVASE